MAVPSTKSLFWDLLKGRMSGGLASVLPTSHSLLKDLNRSPSKTMRIPVRRAPQTDDMRQMLDDLGIVAGRACHSRRRRNVLTFATVDYTVDMLGMDMAEGAA